MEYLPFAVSVISSFIAIAVSWGVITTRVEEIRREIATMEAKIKECPTKEGCLLRHEKVEQNISDIKDSIKEIKELLRSIVSKVGNFNHDMDSR